MLRQGDLSEATAETGPCSHKTTGTVAADVYASMIDQDDIALFIHINDGDVHMLCTITVIHIAL